GWGGGRAGYLGARPAVREATGRGAQPRQLIVTVYGLYSGDAGGWMSVASLVSLLADLGVDEPAVRSSISRLKRRGMLLARKGGAAAGYELSAGAQAILREGGHRIFRRGRGRPGGGGGPGGVPGAGGGGGEAARARDLARPAGGRGRAPAGGGRAGGGGSLPLRCAGRPPTCSSGWACPGTRTCSAPTTGRSATWPPRWPSGGTWPAPSGWPATSSPPTSRSCAAGRAAGRPPAPARRSPTTSASSPTGAACRTWTRACPPNSSRPAGPVPRRPGSSSPSGPAWPRRPPSTPPAPPWPRATAVACDRDGSFAAEPG